MIVAAKALSWVVLKIPIWVDVKPLTWADVSVAKLPTDRACTCVVVRLPICVEV